MKKQRGIGEIYLVAGAVVIAMGAAIAIQTYRLNELRIEYAEFKAGVEALGRAAEKSAKEKEAKDKLAKEQADAANAKTTATLNAAISKLRAQRPRTIFLPAAPAGSNRPDLACFDRAEYQRADGEATGRLFAGARSLADEGTKNTVDLDTGKGWATQLR